MRSIRIISVFIIGALLVILGCSKADEPATTDTAASSGLWKIYKDSIPGTWTWHHTYIYISTFTGDTTYIIDTVETLRIDLVNDSTLSMGSDTLSYSDSVHYTPMHGARVDTANFVHYWAKGQYHYDGAHSKDLLLNRHTDSLIYLINRTGTALGSQRYEHWRTKIFH